MVSGIEKERKKIEKFFIKQLKDGISLSFYKNRLKQAEELVDKKIIGNDKYEEVKTVYLKKRDIANSINNLVNNLVELIDQSLFFKESDDICKTYFESFLCYGDESLLSNYVSINKDLEKKINTTKDKIVEELDKCAKTISLEEQKSTVIGSIITSLEDYKKVFKDGYDYINKFIDQIKKDNTIKYINDSRLLCVRNSEKNTKLFEMYSYTLSDEIIYILALEKNTNSTIQKKKLSKLKNKYKSLAVYNLRLLYLNSALYYIKDKNVYKELKEKIQDRIIVMKYNLDIINIECSKKYKHLNISKKLGKLNNDVIDKVRYYLYNLICKEIVKNVDVNDYELEGSYYYKYYNEISKKKRILERDLNLIKIPDYVIKSDNKFSIDYLKERYIDLYLEKGKCNEEEFNIIIDKSLKEDIVNKKEKIIDNNKHENIDGYKDNYYDEPLKLVDDIISNFSDFSSVKLSENLKIKREFLFNQYESLIVQPDYRLTFYEFLKQNGDLVDNDILSYERDVEFFSTMLYRIYSEYKVKKSFVSFSKERGLKDVPLQYIKPELFVKLSVADKYKEEDNKALEDMINEALISISEGE